MVGVALIGSGWAIDAQIPGFRTAGLEIVALVGRSAEKTAALAAKHGVPFSSSSLAEVLARPEVDIVSVVTPPSTHIGYAKQILAAGKHVLCEKPFALNVAEAREMEVAHREAIAKAGKPVLAIIDHELRFHSSLQAVKAFILSGEFGRIQHAQVTYFSLHRTMVHGASWHWWHDREAFGGILGAVGSHYVDFLSFLTSTQAVRVSGDLRTCIKTKPDAKTGTPKDVTSDDIAMVRAVHRSQTKGVPTSFGGSDSAPQEFTLTATFTASSVGLTRQEVVLLSDRGAITIDLSTVTATFVPATLEHPAGGEPTVWRSTSIKTIPNEPPPNPFNLGTLLLGQHLVRAVEEVHSGTTGDDLPASLAGIAATFNDGIYTQIVLGAIRASSAQDGAWIDIDAPDA